MSADTVKIKVVVWDLDNTVWHGTLTEGDELVLRDNIRAIMEELDRRGVLQSIASKNTHADAWKMVEEFGLDHFFLYPQINWGAKSESIAKIKELINIGFDAIAFFDDTAYERDEVKFVHEEVQIYDVDQIAGMLDQPQFMPRFVTAESAQRRLLYQADAQRNEESERFENNQEFLRSLDMKFRVSAAVPEDLKRVEELTVRTNQLNATGYTYSYEELLELLDSDEHQLYVAELVDRYGTYGKIGVALLERRESTWHIKLLLMSCRVMARGVGTVLLNFLINNARALNAGLAAEFKHTDRNRMMFMTYKFAGFSEAGELPGGGVMLEHALEADGAYPDYIELDLPAEPPFAGRRTSELAG